MAGKDEGSGYPRVLSDREREWIEWILPREREGYRRYRDLIAPMRVIGEGRRGKGELVLGVPGDAPDLNGPLAPVLAYGAIETTFGMISVTIREVQNDQISVEIVSHRSEEVPEEYEESRRWTYSTWNPGNGCPQCRGMVREIPMVPEAQTGAGLVLALCPTDRRIWVHDRQSLVNYLIPVTNYYNELMLHKNIRDPKVALDAKHLFEDLPRYPDSDLAYAFLTYNKLRSRIPIAGTIRLPESTEKRSLGRTLRNLFMKK